MNANRTQQMDARRLELREGWFFHFPSDDEAEIRASQLGKPHFRIKDKLLGGWLRSALSKLDGNHPVGDVLNAVPEKERQSLENILSALQRKFLYEKSISHAGSLPSWLSHALGQRETAFQVYADAVARANLVVIGAGRLGRSIATHLGELGANRVIVLEPTGTAARESSTTSVNKDRGIEHATVDMKALAAKLTELQADLVILAMDYFAPRIADVVNRVSLTTDTRWIFCLVDGWSLYAGPCFIPHESGCFECMLNSKFPDAVRMPDGAHSHESIGGRIDGILNPAFCGLLAGLVIADVPNLLGRVPYVLEKSGSLLLGAQVAIDLREYEVNLSRIARLTGCVACAH